MVVETALYERLGVSHDASTDQIRRSYRQAALLWHPDRNRDNPEAAEKFKACLEAYEILSNPNQRTLYDAYGLSGVLRTGGDPEMSPEAQPQRTTSSSSSRANRQRSYRQRPQPPPFDDSFFNDDDFFVFPEQSAHFDFPRPSRPMHTQTQSQTQSQSQSQSQRAPRGFSFSSSFTFSTSSSSGGGPGGSYTTHTHSWNSRDGHQSHHSSGTFGPGGHRVSSSNRDGGDGSRRVDAANSSRRNSQRTRNYTDDYVVPQQSQPQSQSQSQSMYSQQQSPPQPAQGMQHPFFSNTGGGGMFDMGSNFNNLFAGMSNNFASFFGNNIFGEPESTMRPQQSRQWRQ